MNQIILPVTDPLGLSDLLMGLVTTITDYSPTFYLLIDYGLMFRCLNYHFAVSRSHNNINPKPIVPRFLILYLHCYKSESRYHISLGSDL